MHRKLHGFVIIKCHGTFEQLFSKPKNTFIAMIRLRSYLTPLNIFYLLMAYVLAFFIWWTVFHFKNIKEIHETYIRNAELAEILTGLDSLNVTDSKLAIARANSEYNARTMMILGEGGVFFAILLLAAFWINRGFKQEMLLNAQQRNFMLSITHELKSPLAGIRLSTETMLSRVLDYNRQKRLLQNSLKDTERLQSLVENILTAAKLENQSMELALIGMNFSGLVNDISQKLIESIGQNHEFIQNIEPDIWVNGDRVALVSIITNLIENAIKYTDKNGIIQISLVSSDQLVQFIVADNGSGIPDSEKNKVFQKFYRVGSEDTRKTKGTGLGLFLVKELVEMHKGSIKITDNLNQGSIFIVEMPCFKQHIEINMNHDNYEEIEFDSEAYKLERLG